MVDLAGTWNTTGAPTSIKMNVTDVASSNSSLLMDLQTNGSSRFKVAKDGAIEARTITTTSSSVNLSAISSTGHSLTGSSAVSMVDLAGTWNTSGTPTAIKLNIANTASNAASLLMDLQTDGASKFKVRRDGAVTWDRYLFSGYNTFAFLDDGNAAFQLGSTAVMGWTAAGAYGGAADTVLRRDGAANTLALRNSTAAQTFRLYNTFTDTSNYARGFVRWSSDQFLIGTEKAGTGAASNGFLQADGFTTLQWGGFGGGFATMTCGLASASPGVSDLGYSAGIGGAFRRLFLSEYIETSEMTAPAAPAANGVRIYAEDNGSGKTRLMAKFATGAAVQIAIEP